MTIKRRLQAELHDKKCMLEKATVDVGSGEEDRFVISLSLTTPEALALFFAIENHDTPAGKQLLTYFRDAIKRA